MVSDEGELGNVNESEIEMSQVDAGDNPEAVS